MALDKSIMLKVLQEIDPQAVRVPKGFELFAEAIYALGVAEERERCAQICECIEPLISSSATDECAEAIRKGE